MSAPLPDQRPLRDYQTRACAETEEAWSTCRAVCLVAPTGSGKTRMGSELAVRAKVANQAARILWVTHRTELIEQSRDALEERGLDVGTLSARQMDNTEADTIVASWQTLVSRSTVRPAADLLIVDEAHHAAAEEWATILDAYPEAKLLGLTATPQRRDGKPLAPPFERLVVAAQYSELLKAGHLVACRLFRPEESLGSNLAKEPLAAYEECAKGKSCILFARTIDSAVTLAEEFTAAGYPAACISAKTAALTRADSIDAFKAGELRVLTCVYTLTEGFDHPATEVCLLARGCGHTSTYLQMVGRVLRPAPGKTEALVIDLPGISHVHGVPTEDRIYSLEGRAISSSAALKVCPECGYTWEPEGEVVCPSCGWRPEKVEVPLPRIYDLSLVEVYAGADTPDDAKTREWARLRTLCAQRGWTIGFAIKEFRKLFSHAPPLGTVTDDEWRAEFMSLEAFRVKRGYKPGFSLVRFKEMSGRWPRREWRVPTAAPPEDFPF